MPGSLVGVSVRRASREEGFSLFALLLAFAAVALILPMVARRLGPLAFLLAALPPAAACVWALTNWGALADGGAVEEQVEWVPSLGLTLGMRLDGFGFLMVGLVAGTGVLVFCYAAAYFHRGDPVLGRFSATLLVFSGAMLVMSLISFATRDIGATIYAKLGIPLDLITMTADGRPMLLSDGQPIKPWM